MSYFDYLKNKASEMKNYLMGELTNADISGDEKNVKQGEETKQRVDENRTILEEKSESPQLSSRKSEIVAPVNKTNKIDETVKKYANEVKVNLSTIINKSEKSPDHRLKLSDETFNYCKTKIQDAGFEPWVQERLKELFTDLEKGKDPVVLRWFFIQKLVEHLSPEKVDPSEKECIVEFLVTKGTSIMLNQCIKFNGTQEFRFNLADLLDKKLRSLVKTIDSDIFKKLIKVHSALLVDKDGEFNKMVETHSQGHPIGKLRHQKTSIIIDEIAKFYAQDDEKVKEKLKEIIEGYFDF